MGFKKKLYKLNPDKEGLPVVIQSTKRDRHEAKVTEQSNERNVREMLANRISGTHMGLWLLVPGLLRLGIWDLLKGCFASAAKDNMNARLAMQLVNESALCVHRIRSKDSLCNQGFCVVNGLHFLAADETVHTLLGSHSMQTYEQLQVALLQLRELQNDYNQQRIFAID